MLSKLWFAARLGCWLLVLPVVVRLRTLPLLLESLGAAPPRPRGGNLELNRAVAIVARVCRMGFFDLPVFPRPCLRRSLALYSTLTRMGHPVEIHFGVRKDGGDLHGHSWVTLQGKTLAEKSPAHIFRTIYSSASSAKDSWFQEIGEARPS